MRASKLVVKTTGKSVVSATRKTNERVQITVAVIDRCGAQPVVGRQHRMPAPATL